MDAFPAGAALEPSAPAPRPARAAVDPVIAAAVPVVAAAFCVLRAAGLLARVPYPLLVVLVAAAGLVSAGLMRWCADPGQPWHLPVFVAADTAVIGVVAYATGWGPLLAVGFVFGGASAMRLFGSRATPWAAAATVLAMAVGQVAIDAHVAPILIGRSLLPGLTTLAGLGAVLTIVLLGMVTTARERADADLSQSERRFKALVADATDIITVVDRNGHLKYVSPAFERTLGLSPATFENESIGALIHPDDVAEISARMQRQEAAPGPVRARLRIRDVAGQWRHFEATITDRSDDPDVDGIVGSWHEITDLLEANARFRSAFEDAPIGMALAQPDGTILRSNRAFGAIVGRAPESLVGTSVMDLTHPDDRYRTASELSRISDEQSDGYQLEKRYVRPDGQEVWTQITTSVVRDSVGNVQYGIAQVQDITEARQLREDLAHAAIHDPLTGLPNRALFVDRLEQALGRSGPSRAVAVAFLDLDRFKLVNDGLGHAAGDHLLQDVANRLQEAAGPGTTVARFGGDEFTVLWEEVGSGHQALDTTRGILDALRHPFELGGSQVFVSASAGVVVAHGQPAVNGQPAVTAAGMLRDADTAMYLAKERGPGRVELFDDRSHATALQSLHVMNELHSALNDRQLRLHYQPIVDLGTGDVVAIEALVRWQHPQRGLLAPAAFISAAEECGLIVPLGTWVLREACRQAAAWHVLRPAGPPLQVHVNLAPQQLVSPDFVDTVAEALADSGLAPGALCLEITESTLMRDEAAAASALRAVRALGVCISLDDFGTGYSSLSYLKRFPIDSLKVDRSFVDGLGDGDDQPVIVSAVITLAHSLGMTAVAEGVETPRALEELVRLGCDRIQGFLVSRPVPAEALGRRLADPTGTWLPDPAPLPGH